jgi:spore coat polysaccharide biosynthesis predicted glycosyltransferase SpsG/RimJ/RimL family protein N-acetyltransferase
MPDTPRVALRRATAADSRCLWEIRNEESVRAVSLDTAPIPFERHQRWLAARLEAAAAPIFIVSAPDAGDVGYVRFDAGPGELQVSIALAPHVRGRGLGPAALRTAMAALDAGGGHEPVVALVRRDNAPSLAAFARAGFVARGERRVGDTSVAVLGWPVGRVLLAADGGPAIGLGHLGRVLALAAALDAEGAWAGVVAPGAGAFRARVEARGRAAVTIEGWPAWDDAALARVQAAAREAGASTLVVDSYRASDAALERWRAAGLTLVAFDDLAASPSPCHVVIDPSPAAATVARASRHRDTRFLLGPAYAPLRPEFGPPPVRKTREHVETVVLTLGGGEVPGLTQPLLDALDAAPGDFAVDALVGPFADPAPLAAAVARCRRAVRVHHDPPDLRALFVEADLAVSAAGQTLFELAWAGCPTLAIAVADNQRANLAGFAARGTVRAVESPGAADFRARLTRAVGDLLTDTEARRAMTAAGQRLVDGAGARRVAAAALGREAAA